MQTRRLVGTLPLLMLVAACGGEEPLGIQDLGSLQANNTTAFAVVGWHYRECGTTEYSEEVGLGRLPGARIEPGGAATVQFPGDECFDHRFTLDNGATAVVPEVTVPKLDIISINISLTETTETGAE